MIEKIFLTEKLQDENPYEKLVNEIRSSPDYLNLILEASDPWILQDMNGFILDLSASFADKIGYDPDKLRGRYLQALRAVPLIQRSRLRIVLDRIGEEYSLNPLFLNSWILKASQFPWNSISDPSRFQDRFLYL